MDKTIDLMRKYGGSFAASLADTYCHADFHNRRKILVTWPELFSEYGPDGIFWPRPRCKEES